MCPFFKYLLWKKNILIHVILIAVFTYLTRQMCNCYLIWYVLKLLFLFHINLYVPTIASLMLSRSCLRIKCPRIKMKKAKHVYTIGKAGVDVYKVVFMRENFLWLLCQPSINTVEENPLVETGRWYKMQVPQKTGFDYFFCVLKNRFIVTTWIWLTQKQLHIAIRHSVMTKLS